MNNYSENDSRTRELCHYLPGVDVKQALIRMRGNHDLYIRILRSYEQTFRNFSDTIRKLAEAGDTDQIMQQFHTLKGASANLEITQVYRLSQYLEDRLRQGEDIFILSEYQSFTAALKASLDQISEMDDEGKENAGKLVSIAELTAALQKLEIMLSDYDTGAGEILHRITPALVRLGMADEVSCLEKSTSRYAFDEARIVCNTILHRLPVKGK